MVDQHCPDDCLCDICSGRIRLDEMEEKERGFLESPGWYAHMVAEDPDSPTGFNYHTHGFDITVDHPNIQMVLPVAFETCHAIAASIYERIKRGEKFEPGKEYGEIIGSHDEDAPDLKVMFIDVTECDRPVLRVIFPDAEGHLLARDMTAESPDFALQWTP